METKKYRGSGNSASKHAESPLGEILVMNTILNNSQDTIYFKDRESRILLSSKAHAAYFNVDNPEEVIGKTDFDYFPDAFARNALEDEQRVMETGIPLIGKLEKLEKDDGTVIWFSASKYPLFDTEGNIIGTWGTSRDITGMKLAEEELERVNARLKEANRQLEILSLRDSLSGLYNHRHFFEEMQKLFDLYLRHREKGKVCSSSIIVFDVDFFKKINDSFGHLMGDFVIRRVAEILKSSIRKSDAAFRYGGDEFVVLLKGASNRDAKNTGEKIRRRIEETPMEFNGEKINITVSGGICCFDEVNNVNLLLEKADNRLYASKRNGRNRIT